jgi:hypothetical protein
MITNSHTRLLLIVCAALLLGGCVTGRPFHSVLHSDALLFTVPDDDSDAARYAPLFAPHAPNWTHNRIGTPMVKLDEDGAEVVTINPDFATLYHQAIDFKVAHLPFTNHVYRVHFEKVPWAFKPSRISMGKNVGLLVIVTVDQDGTPLLMTTVHSCGCYVAIFPTQHLPRTAYPNGWPRGIADTQRVWGERPPAMIGFPLQGSLGRPVLHLRDGSHRIAAITPFNPNRLGMTVTMALAPMADLDNLPINHTNNGTTSGTISGITNGETTSLFHLEGPRKGYVKGAHKPLEWLFVSWWSWDAHVGHDKRYGPAEETGKNFYTSLKPWNRQKSDMWDFANFLEFWGWNLSAMAEPPNRPN